MRMQSLLNRALFGQRKGDLKDYTNGLKETFAKKKGKKSADAIIISNREYSTISLWFKKHR